ncbi:hypothetical protein GQ600_8358 [Phytophthora cactorum]|nr:hypothetical protein GQ600_8358 [Phytophthora cactorum]
MQRKYMSKNDKSWSKSLRTKTCAICLVLQRLSKGFPVLPSPY